MKDALGHGSNGFGTSNRVDLARNKIGIAPDARFTLAPRPVVKASTNDKITELRQRLSAPKGGLLHSFTSGLKTALGV